MKIKVLKSTLLPLLLLSLILVAWQLFESAINQDLVAKGKTSLEFFIPTPVTILEVGWEKRNIILQAMFKTLEKAFVGFFIGMNTAVIISVVYDLFPIIRTATMPIAFAIQSFPIIGLAPAIILLFGQDSFLSFVSVSAILVYFPILLSLDESFNNLNKDYVNIGYVYNASRWQQLRYFKLPLSAPAFLTSLKLAAPASIVGATIGEWIGSSNGIGRMITVSMYQLQPGILYSCLIILATVSASTVITINLFEYIFFRWISLTRYNK